MICRFALSISACALLAACGSQPPFGAPGGPAPGLLNRRTMHVAPRTSGAADRVIGSPDYKMRNSLLYVVNFVTNTDQLGDVAVYDAKAKHAKPLAIITKGLDQPVGDCIDASGTLYVTNQSGFIAEYAPGHTKPRQYITKGRGVPLACTIDTNGNLWVAALSDVIEYLRGSKKPHKFIENGVAYANSVVFDKHGNMYVGNLLADYSEQSYIGVYSPGRNSPSRTITDGIYWPVETATDAKGTFYVANGLTNSESGCGNVEEYRTGQSQPSRTITDEISGPSGLTFNENGLLYEANGGINQCNSYVDLILEFPHGSVTPSKRTITIFRSPSGIAYYPPQVP